MRLQVADSAGLKAAPHTIGEGRQSTMHLFGERRLLLPRGRFLHAESGGSGRWPGGIRYEVTHTVYAESSSRLRG
jgi:hypothetical protein